ncbi:MAG: xanthine phosphoribosyltransferase [Clostridiaceae bacterium]|nr:xanthine phosphoribosyltransferase [Oscillospiraceae bacterium]NLO62398.1 xanthine phosphoribosyltransferase [Clostridiaceae bacterium]
MELLKSRIISEGRIIGTDILKVDSFLNHQIDPLIMEEIGKAFAKEFSGEGITKVLTIESSGIAPALSTARFLGVPAIFARKTTSRNLDTDTYVSTVHSFTKGTDYVIRVSKRYLDNKDVVLLIDDFLAKGCALKGLIDVVAQSGAKLAGAGIVIEKGFQEGGDLIRSMGIRVHSLAIINEMSEKENQISFKDEDDFKK